MQLNSLYTTHDMRLSNILQQYDYTFSYGLKYLQFDTQYSGDSGIVYDVLFENLYSPHNSDSSRDKIDTKLYNKDNKNKLN